MDFFEQDSIMGHMSKRYSGKSFKDSSVKKKSKSDFKEKRRIKKNKKKNQSN